DLDYGFEFMWPQVRNYRVLLLSLLSTLNKCLPSFTFTSGAKLGDELDVLDINNSKGSITRSSCNFYENILSPLHKILKIWKRSVVDESILSLEVQKKTTPIPLPRNDVKSHYLEMTSNNNLEQPGKNLQRTIMDGKVETIERESLVTRASKTTDSAETDSSASNSDCAESPYIETFMFKLEYGDDVIAFHLPISSLTIVAVKKKSTSAWRLILADKAILLGANNRPPMLEKDMYDSWKSIMELYMLNRQHGRMIPESVENGPLLWPTVEENRVTRPKKYSELSKLDEDKEGKAVDPSHYRGMIGTLLYLTGLWYLKDSSVALTAFANADHAG
nr:hypothetical protein [Tanacetum cinerariifolium]